MQPFFLTAVVLVLALIYYGIARMPTKPCKSPPPPEEDAYTLACGLLTDTDTLERLGEAIEALRTVMDHPELGGPGFLSIQFPQQNYAGSAPTVSVQFPNINEGLYRRIVRQELDQAMLIEAGVPKALFDHDPAFSTESGGMVLLSVEVHGVAPALEQLLAGRKSRSSALAALTEALERRYPDLSIRSLGPDLLLTPIREAAPIEQ